MTEPWIIRRTDQGGGYLAPPGSERSYTSNRYLARRFPNREAAAAECCGNETPVKLL